MNRDLDDMLNDLPPKESRAKLSALPELAEAIRYFLERKADGDKRVAHVSLAWFYRRKLKPEYDGAPTIEAVRTYVRDQMGLDPVTGKRLDDGESS